jgi:hypothetical protein
LTIRGIEIAIAVLSVAYFRIFPRHWARGVVFVFLFALTGLDVLTRLVLGLDLPFRFTVWSGIFLGLAGLDQYGRRRLPPEDDEASQRGHE